ncbi:acylphosphatase, partial [Gracilibacillus dipsosauri]|uniref:acylphosphatase n=1 Tax=Gracilibacillus dipsosauri TaxID=178340 RepID=UPI002409B5BA
YVDIVNTLERNYTNYIEVKSLEVNEEIISKRLILTGKVKNVGFKKWAKKKAIVHNIDGHIKDHSKNSLEIIAAGPSEDVMQFIKSCKKGPKKAKVKNVEELDWDKEIMLGFKAFTKNTINYEKYYKKLSQKLDSTIKEYEELEKQYNKLLEDYQKQKNKGGLQFFKKVSRLLKK